MPSTIAPITIINSLSTIKPPVTEANDIKILFNLFKFILNIIVKLKTEQTILRNVLTSLIKPSKNPFLVFLNNKLKKNYSYSNYELGNSK